jgi:Nucleoside-diphosphate-sugar epimerases
MRVLILGGTQFVGRHIAEAFLNAGHAVSILTRGVTPDPLPAAVERLRGDRDAGDSGLDALGDRSWDACIDVSGYTPRQVRPSAVRLRDRVARYVFVSAVSVYGDPDRRPVREDQPLLPPAAEDVTEIDAGTYGPLKVACERVVGEIYGERATLLRPQVVSGPYDPSGRYTYWVDRAARGGPMLAPGDGTDHVQVIDARDVARFTVKVAEDGLGGAFNLAGPRLTWAEFLRVLSAEQPVWVPAEILREAGLTFVDLPLYRPEHGARGARASLMDVSSDRAQAAGLTLTDPALTAQDTRAWSKPLNLLPALPPGREAELMRRANPGLVQPQP